MAQLGRKTLVTLWSQPWVAIGRSTSRLSLGVPCKMGHPCLWHTGLLHIQEGSASEVPSIERVAVRGAGRAQSGGPALTQIFLLLDLDLVALGMSLTVRGSLNCLAPPSCRTSIVCPPSASSTSESCPTLCSHISSTGSLV